MSSQTGGRIGLAEKLKTISAITITPMHETTGEVDWDGVEKNTNWLIEQGMKVLVPCGNTSEFYSLTLDEAREEIRRVVKIADGRAIIMPGIGYSVKEAIALGKFAQAAGADCVMIHQPIQPFVTDRGALQYFTEVMEALDIPSIIYWKDPQVSDDVLAALCEMEQLVGVKYAINDIPRFAELVRRVPKEHNVTWICGTAEKWAPFFYYVGATGFTSGLVNVCPDKSLAMLNALQTGDQATVWRIWDDVLPFENLRAKYNNGNNVAVVKAAVNLAKDRLGYEAGTIRPPAAPLQGQDAEQMQKIVQGWGLC